MTATLSRQSEQSEVVPTCGATFLDAADEPVSCSLGPGHEGRHYDRGFTWVPDLRRHEERG